MINLTTGQPGAGKTLYSLWYIHAMAEREGRPVYYSGISDLKLPWIELNEPEKWYECPAGAIIVIDECQRIFRPRVGGSKVPEAVARMETHRHAGHDLFLITQHPMLLDSNIRRLVGSHRHVVRAFGAKASNIHEWGEVREQPDKNRAGSQQTLWKYPKEVFDYYKSAELHTHKFRLPPRVYFLLAAPVLVGACVWGFYTWWSASSSGKAAQAVKAAPHVQGVAVSGDGKVVKTMAEFVAERQPRIAGLAHTAPVYDEVTKPVDAPVPVGCVESKRTGCHCYTQQGTKYETTQDLCRNIMANGLFIDWKKPETVAQADPRIERKPEPVAAREAAPVDKPEPWRNTHIPELQGGSHIFTGGLSDPPKKTDSPVYSLVPKG